MNLGQLWDSLVDCICRPPRDDEYTVDDLVGGATGREKLAGCWVTRKDLVLTNKKGLKLQCSHYIPAAAKGRDGKLPCVIYCHCNSGSRRDADEALVVLITQGVSVFALDFAGSGLSEGKYVTLGAHEADDVEVVVQHLRATGTVSTLGLWGRSMGAVTALMYSARDPSIAGMVLDSPFCKLTDLMMEIVEREKLSIPKAFTKVALAAMKRSVRKRAEFDISEVTPLEVVSQSYIPALFGHASGDSFIGIKHSERLFEVYAGDKNMIKVEGDHNSRRPEYFYNSVAIFFHNTLQLDTMLEGGNRLNGEATRREASSSSTCNSMVSGRKAPGSPHAVAAGAASHHHHHHALGATGVPWELEALRANSVSLRRQTISSSLDSGNLARPSQPNLFPGADSSNDNNSSHDAGSFQEALEDAELMEAIRLSLLLEQEKQQQQQAQPPQQLQQQSTSTQAAPTGPLGAAATTGRRTAGGGGGAKGSAAGLGAAQSNGSVGGSSGAAHVASSSRQVELLAPQTAEAEEEQLQRALELSLQEGHSSNCGHTATSSSQPAQPAAASAAGSMPSQQQNFVDLLTAELGEGLKQTRLT